jgi:hypothetical protein
MTAVRAVRASMLLSLVLALSGCGLTGQGFQPGVAVVVGDQTITQKHVGELTGDYCRGVGDALKKQGQKVSLRYLSSQVIVPQLAIRLLVEQLADQMGVEPSDQYRGEVSTLRSRVADLDEAAADAVIEVESARSYYIDVLTTIGKESGDSGGSADPSADQSAALTSGREVLSRWMARDADRLAVNPRYGIRFAETEDEANKEGPLIRTGGEDDVSFAVSDQAKGGLAPATAEDPKYLASLPARMTCG